MISRHSSAVSFQVTPWVTGNCVEILIGSSCATFSFVVFQISSSKALIVDLVKVYEWFFSELIWYCREQVSERGISDNSEVHEVQALNCTSRFIIWLLVIVAFDFRFNLKHFTFQLNSWVKNLGIKCFLIYREIFFSRFVSRATDEDKIICNEKEVAVGVWNRWWSNFCILCNIGLIIMFNNPKSSSSFHPVVAISLFAFNSSRRYADLHKVEKPL